MILLCRKSKLMDLHAWKQPILERRGKNAGQEVS